MGEPETIDDVFDFLNCLFSDQDLIPLSVQKYELSFVLLDLVFSFTILAS
jgi:protoheme ferro-lyase